MLAWDVSSVHVEAPCQDSSVHLPVKQQLVMYFPLFSEFLGVACPGPEGQQQRHVGFPPDSVCQFVSFVKTGMEFNSFSMLAPRLLCCECRALCLVNLSHPVCWVSSVKGGEETRYPKN